METKGQIEKVSQRSEKLLAEPSIRQLWRTCFGDPPEYESFYFKHVYQNNLVYRMDDRGMLHLNPYTCSLRGESRMLYYIVGVATDARYRRTGVMRSILKHALEKLYADKHPFTWLMPADVRYYEPFDFVSVSKGMKTEFSVEDRTFSGMDFLDYNEFRQQCPQEQQREIWKTIDRMLAQQSDLYTIHDAEYFELLYHEKNCQNGNVVFCFEEKQLKGFFAYAMDGTKLRVEQYLFRREESGKNDRRAEDWISEYCRKCGKDFCKSFVRHQFPYMIRIVHVEEFLNLFADYFTEFAEAGKGLFVTDTVLAKNTGIYTFTQSKGHISIKRQEREADDTGLVRFSVSGLADYVFTAMNREGNRIFFAEIV